MVKKAPTQRSVGIGGSKANGEENLANFRVATGLLRRLGEELNPSFDQSVLELVKNAYDADASTCTVSLASRTLIVKDDGDGMREGQIRDGWLVLGSSMKDDSERRSPKGRLVVGSKGLGRLAALRLGTDVSLRTTSFSSSGQPTTLEVAIDWARFDDASIIEEVEFPIRLVATNTGERGTTTTINGIRASVGRMEVKRLARSLVLLADPFGGDPSGFQPSLKTKDYRDLDRLVQQRYFDDAEYHLRANLDESGQATAELKDWTGKTLFRATHEDLTKDRKGAAFKTPPCTFDFWAFLLSEATFSTRKVTLSEVREWLESFGGVHVYHNGIRVRPYGDPGHDWLELNLQRAKSPEHRPSTNNSIGRVDLKDPEHVLRHKTDRVGFIEDKAFLELKAFATAAVDWMTRRRMEQWNKKKQREKARSKRDVPESKKKLAKAVEGVSPAKRKKIEKAIEAYEKTREKETQLLREDLQLYRTLATAGIVAATFAHEVQGNPIKVIKLSLATVIRRLAKAKDQVDFAKDFSGPIEAIKSGIEGLSVLATSTLSLLAHEKRRASKVDLHDEIRSTVLSFEPFLKQRNVECEMQLDGRGAFLLAPPAGLESILSNLLNNAIVALDGEASGGRKILISTQRIDGEVTLWVEDSGPGIRGISTADVWLAGHTTKTGGTGLGLTIVRDIARELGGDASAEANGKALGGAVIRVELPVLED